VNASLFVLSLVLSVGGPILAISYLRPILQRVLRTLCDADGGAEFWIRCALLLAITGTLLLSLTFGVFDADATLLTALRRALWLVATGIFATVAYISGSVWSQVGAMLAERRRPIAPAVPAAAAGVQS
jgi:hypothetical protein